MANGVLVYNERAWAGDLLKAINEYARIHEGQIRQASGEYGVRIAGAHTLFPDILLFADENSQSFLQGWELKFPDTDTDAEEVIENAYKKAMALGLKTFLIWNVNYAVLWQINDGKSQRVREWCLRVPLTRQTVKENRQIWIALLETILADLNDLFSRRAFRTLRIPFEETLNHTYDVLFIRAKATLPKHLQLLAQTQEVVRVELARRNLLNRQFGDKTPAHESLADALLLGWVLRLLSAHGMSDFYEALRQFSMTSLSSPQATLMLFKNIVATCDHAHLFGESPLDACLSDEVWEDLCSFHDYLRKVVVTTPNRQCLQQFVDRLVPQARKQFLGQFPTPSPLARLLVRATGMRQGPMWDPCCGTGTIAQALCSLREDYGESPATARTKVWASDIDDFPLRLTSVALSHPEAMQVPIQAFLADAALLEPHTSIPLTDPVSGISRQVVLPTFDLIASNLPFVCFEDAPRVALPKGISGRADYAITILTTLDRHLSERGALAVLLPNAWFGTDWGRDVFRFLTERYNIKSVVISGAGRWFTNADIVVSLIVLDKKSAFQHNIDDIAFAVTRTPIQQWTTEVTDEIADALLARQCYESDVVSVSIKKIYDVWSWLNAGLALTASFAEMGWWHDVVPYLVPFTDIFTVGRGVRWGWDEFFYVSDNSGIEADYLRPLFKTSSGHKRLVAYPDSWAFCCDASIEELTAKGANGALARIETFQPLLKTRKSLAKQPDTWYQSGKVHVFTYALSLNPYELRLVFRLAEPCILNQRLIGLQEKEKWCEHRDLLHALLNSSLMAFLCEAVGFGRGQGVLDMNTTTFSKLPFLNPSCVTPESEQIIVRAFMPLLKREILPLEKELKRADRQAFEYAIFEAFGLQHHAKAILNDLLMLQSIRLTVKQKF